MARKRSATQPPARETRAPIFAYIAAGGVVVLQERRPNNTPGIEWHIPKDEWDHSILKRFREEVCAKQGLTGLRLVRATD